MLRNALLPTIAVIAVQCRVPRRRPRRRRVPVQLPGARRADARGGAPEGPAAADRRRARDRDRLPRRDADRRHPLRLPQPANPLRGRHRVSIYATPGTLPPDPAPLPGTERSESRAARAERFRLLLRSPSVVIGAIVIVFWIFCALFPRLVAPYDPDLRQQLPDEPAADLGSPVRHRHERTRCLLPRARRLTGRAPDRPGRDAPRRRARDDAGADHRLPPRRRRRRRQPVRRRSPVAASHRDGDPHRHRRRQVVDVGDRLHHRPDLRAGRVADGSRGRARRGRPRLRAGGAPAWRAVDRTS